MDPKWTHGEHGLLETGQLENKTITDKAIKELNYKVHYIMTKKSYTSKFARKIVT